MVLTCVGVTCVGNATCAIIDGGYTCRCNVGFKGDGYSECKPATIGNLDEHYEMVIILIVLLFVGLVAILIFFLCRRSIKEKRSSTEYLVTTPEKDPYDMKWEMLLSEIEPNGSIGAKDVPPPYNDIDEHKQQPEIVTSFCTEGTEVVKVDEEERVPVEPDDEEYEDEVEEAQEYDNPSYDVVVLNNDDISHTSIPMEDVKTEVAEEFESAFMGKVYTNPTFEGDSRTDEEKEILPEPEEEEKYSEIEPIKFTIEETRDTQNSITATITTPTGNITINLNLNTPSASNDSSVEPVMIDV